jgi:hypothetical protein
VDEELRVVVDAVDIAVVTIVVVVGVVVGVVVMVVVEGSVQFFSTCKANKKCRSFTQTTKKHNTFVFQKGLW